MPSNASLRSLAKVLGVAVDDLLGPARAPARHFSAGLAAFLKSYAPSDLTEEELNWLASVPASFGSLTAMDYLELLRGLRPPAPGSQRLPFR